MKKEKNDSLIEEKSNDNESKISDPFSNFQASWMDNNLFEELEDIHMGSVSRKPEGASNRPPLMSFDSI